MIGNSILLDTNALIYFFEGREVVTQLVVSTPAIYYSVISKIELLSAPHLRNSEITNIKSFLSLCHQVELTSEIVARTIYLRRDYRLKIPDAVIAASALVLDVPLISADTDFGKVDNLNLVSNITT